MSLTAGGQSIQASVVRTADASLAASVTLPVGKLATSWVKSDADTAACNLTTGHGIVTGKVDVHWVLGGVYYNRFNVDATVTVDAVALDGGVGDDFPASATATCVLTTPVSITLTIDGDELEILGMFASAVDPASVAHAHVLCQDVSANAISDIDLAANVPQIWDIAGNSTNVFTGAIIRTVKASNGSTVDALTLNICGIYDSTP